MMVYRQFHEGIAYDKREPFTLQCGKCDVHGLVLFTDRDPRMQPPEWDRREHYRVGVVVRSTKGLWPFPTGSGPRNTDECFTFKMWLEKNGKQVRFDNDALRWLDNKGSVKGKMNIPALTGPQDVVFGHVITSLCKYFERNV